MAKRLHHVVRRPGRRHGDPDLDIPVADDLATVPGIPLKLKDLAFYSREHPLESQNVDHSADRDWAKTVYTKEVISYREGHEERNKPLVLAALESADLEPTNAPYNPEKDVTEDIRLKARNLGFGEVGFTKYDRRYTYASKKRWVKYDHAICLALEQNYVQTQTIPSLTAEHAHFGTYETEGALVINLAGYIRSLGYRAQIHSPSDASGAYIPMFVASGLGQLGANGQLLSPHFGSRSRLTIITTNAPVTYDQPVDYGIHKFCQNCQVCVDRCPGRALMKEKVWWRGIEKNKLVYERCRPVMAKYEGCAVCMKVCPIQRYGMKPVMEHYVSTGEVLGKDTENLEGYSLRGKGHFGPGKLPHFNRDFFEIPKGRREDWLFEEFKKKLDENGMPSKQELSNFALKVKELTEKGKNAIGDA